MKHEEFNPNQINVYKFGNSENNALFKEKAYASSSRAQSALTAEIKKAEYAFDYNEKVIAGFKAKLESDAELKKYYEYEIESTIELNKRVRTQLDYLYACKVYEFSYSLFDSKEVK